ncbi:MAG: cysteine desulfurase [Algoriphagus sp.]|jgi:cysteine desulfurase
MNYPIYIDYAATTPVDERVLKEMLPFFTQHFGNATSRHHAFGWQAEEAVDESKKKIARRLGCATLDIVFTSGATESINLALKGVFENNHGHLITIKTEHKATLDTAEYLKGEGNSVTYLDVDGQGNLDLNELVKAIRPETKLISIMHVNNETGVVLPISEVLKLAHSESVLVHVDATQSLGKLPFPEGADLVSFSGHKIYGPKGIGCLIVKKEVNISTQTHGGKQQRNRRSGTLNVPGIVGLAEAVFLLDIEENERLEKLRDLFEKRVLSELPNARINGQEANRIGNISNISFAGVDGEEILMKLSKVAISNGSACNSASTEPSYVLRAMGLSEQNAFSSLRFSFGRFTTERELVMAADHVIEKVKNLCS